ncbi:MAG TPA: DUF4126 family protein [Candidatus Angelobacter sp.]|jgi:uncharacterized membrane protein|nr:DUF4126 family protein [Candidatus Angelobacter sp.]
MKRGVSAFLLGAAAGMRSMSAPAILSYRMRRQHSGPAFLMNSRTVTALELAAVAELIVDKLPGSPARTAPLALIARICSGGFAGALIAGHRRNDRVFGALLGAAGAVAAAYGMYFVRKAAAEKSGLPDSLFAVAEDASAVALAWKTAA